MKQINMTSIKNTRVRVKDIKAGRTIYVAHPVYGIEEVRIASRPYKASGSLFADCYMGFAHLPKMVKSFSLRDRGITKGASYNGRRAFFKRKQAVAWMDKWQHDFDFKMMQKQHEEDCRMMEEAMMEDMDDVCVWSGY